MTITAEQKTEWQEAREQADAAVDRLNALYEATGRPYRARWGHRKLDLWPAAADDFADDLDGTPGDGYGPAWSRDRVGSEHAESEDESEVGEI